MIASLDYFVRSGKYRGRNADAECFGYLQVDHELECGRLLDRQIGGYGPAENCGRSPLAMTSSKFLPPPRSGEEGCGAPSPTRSVEVRLACSGAPSGQMAQDRNINFILGKPLCVLPKTEPRRKSFADRMLWNGRCPLSPKQPAYEASHRMWASPPL